MPCAEYVSDYICVLSISTQCLPKKYTLFPDYSFTDTVWRTQHPASNMELFVWYSALTVKESSA